GSPRPATRRAGPHHQCHPELVRRAAVTHARCALSLVIWSNGCDELRLPDILPPMVTSSSSALGESRWLMLIDGRLSGSADGRFIDVENPAKRSVIGQVARATEVDVDAAVKAAAAAFEKWRLVPPRERGKLLLAIADAVEADTESIARTLALETGNALRTQA